MRSPFAALLLVLLLCLVSGAQSPQLDLRAPMPNRVSTEYLDSKLMGRKIPYNAIVPPGYAAAANIRYPVIYLLHGLTGHYDNWTSKTLVAAYAVDNDVILITPEGNDGWYTDSASKPNDRYESYIIKELIPEVDRKFRTIADRDHRAIAGLSMGGFGSMKFGLKYPEMFALAGSFSGALGASSYRTLEELPPGGIRTSLIAIFGDPGSTTHVANDIFKIVRDASPEKIKAMPYFYLDCGTEDFLFQNNRDFASLLVEKKIPHEYRQLPGAHNWPYWNTQVREFLRVAEKRMGKSQATKLQQ